MKLKLLLSLILIVFGFEVWPQETFTPNDVQDLRERAHAFTNATIIVDYQTKIDSATLIIKDGKVVQVGANIPIPPGFFSVDLMGKYIYPSLIDLHTSYGLPQVEKPQGGGFGGVEQMLTKTKGSFNANEAIKSHYKAGNEFVANDKSADELRKIGFGAVLTFREDGIARGNSAFVTLGSNSNEVVLTENAAAHYSLNKGTSMQHYPVSIMGFISLLRQTYLDAAWYSQFNPRPFKDQSLETWIDSQNLPQIFDAGDWMNVLRADKVGDEFGVQYIIKSAGDSYKRIKEVKATGASLVVPVAFPDAYEVDDPIEAQRVSLEDMKHWELASTNLGTLEAAGINFAITTAGLNKKTQFIENVRMAIGNGLSETAALKALTETPARLVRMNDQVGSLKKGMIANFIITSGPLFDKKTIIHENWIQGNPFQFKALDLSDYAGTYDLVIDGKTYKMEVTGEPGSQKAKVVVNDSTAIDINGKLDPNLISLSFPEEKKSKENIRLSGWTTDTGWKGTGQLVDGSWINWVANKTGDLKEDTKEKDSNEEDNNKRLGEVIFPFVAYGSKEIPQQETILIRNATVWTNEAEGTLEGTDVLLKDGKIALIGKSLSDPSATIVDGTGKHLTSGIIDEHTHIALSGRVNEAATNSSMVRIGDQVNSEDINIYRSLAGGVTAAQLLHGSANPVGGQSALIKLRWGMAPEELKIKGADNYIKFALGENVKRSIDPNSIRYPQTRMGVEQVFMDGFTNAVEYGKEWDAYNSLPKKSNITTTKPRRDLVDETMLEIINKQRYITCHSYVQSEINMLIKVADNFGFNVNTFTHILEGYKVADKMKAHGVGASTFSDWWNYKWEVRYAIPYNATIMHNEGVVTAINSDDANSGRRLNQEAAKSIKYGGMSEEDAWKMVSLNPAKLLHLDDRMGSIKVGKDADLVLWTNHPLSVYANVEKTIVDGAVYFDVEKDEQARTALQAERARLIQKMKGVKKKGGTTQKGGSSVQLQLHCEDGQADYSFDMLNE
ncbi:MAG: amidohydrolase family protein [Bacteroidetes bacterium]|nr:amidohydrolase family protein [Bacteroidota bacterium]